MRRPVLRAILWMGLMFLALGCGGGGGGGTPSLSYRTDWAPSDGGAVTGQSQRAVLYKSDGAIEETIVLNKPGAVEQEHVFSPSVGGTYKLVVDLYSLPNLNGSRTGTFEAFVAVSSGSVFRSVVGELPTQIRVTPTSATFQVQTSKQFLATPMASSDRATFVAPFSFEWTPFGGHVSVNNTGLALGLSEGSGSIRATHLDSGLFGSSTYTVQPFQTTTSKWTVLVFMNAANDLFPYSTLNMNQMEKVAQNPDVRFIVQWKQSQSLFPGSSFNGTRRYLAKADLSGSIASTLVQDMGTSVDMGLPATLLEFINWAKTYYPAQRYCLVIWNHGNGWRPRPGRDGPLERAVSYDDETGNAIQTHQLAQAIGSNQFDILAWDASLMQMIEVAYEVEDQADFVVGSEESPPGEGYPYDLVFQEFRDDPDATSRNLSKAFVDGMLAVPSYATRKITQSVLDTNGLDALASALSQLATKLSQHSIALAPLIQSVRNQAQSYSPENGRIYRDLIDVLDRLDGQTGIPDVETAIDDARAAALAAIVWEGHNANSAGSRGISIDFSDASSFSSAAGSYTPLKFAQLTQWDEWLNLAP